MLRRDLRQTILPILAPSLAIALILAFAAPASAERWCADGTIKLLAHGSTGVLYVVGKNTTYYQARTVAEPTCQGAWQRYRRSTGARGHVATYVFGAPELVWSRWDYKCEACVYGSWPDWMERVRDLAPISAADASMIAADLAGGVTVDVDLRLTELPDADTADSAAYYVDVLTESGQVQVIVDAATGAAASAEDPPGAVCQ